ncbi:MAG: hypothetical protein HDR85_01610 [Bacteroides sp.]|nr:hypothetical protein [Bacteroides sp.]
MATHQMYSNIVKSDEDIIGLVAYALYKKQKIAFFNKVRKDTGKEPTEIDINAFILNSSTESQIESFRDRAENLLMDVVANVTEEQIKQASIDMLHDYEQKIGEAVKRTADQSFRLYEDRLKDAVKGISDETLKIYEGKIGDAVRKGFPSDWKTIKLNVVGTLLFSVLVTVILFIGNFSERFTKDVVDGVVEKFSNETSSKTPQMPTDSIGSTEAI